MTSFIIVKLSNLHYFVEHNISYHQSCKFQLSRMSGSNLIEGGGKSPVLSGLKDSGLDIISTFKGHSTRSAATSAARNKSVSVMDIMKVADWSNSNTFTKFCYKPIQSSEFGHRILSN